MLHWADDDINIMKNTEKKATTLACPFVQLRVVINRTLMSLTFRLRGCCQLFKIFFVYQQKSTHTHKKNWWLNGKMMQKKLYVLLHNKLGDVCPSVLLFQMTLSSAQKLCLLHFPTCVTAVRYSLKMITPLFEGTAIYLSMIAGSVLTWRTLWKMMVTWQLTSRWKATKLNHPNVSKHCVD